MAFAVASGNFSSSSIWDTGIVPTGSEDAYANSFTVQVSDTRSIGRVRNDATTYTLPGMPIPAMTSNATPTGTAFASSIGGVSTDAWRAFDQNTATVWSTTTALTPTGWLAYTFPSRKIIKRYLFKQTGIPAAVSPNTWTFEGSNDAFATAGVELHRVTNGNPGLNGTYTSPTGSVNTGSLEFNSYRINVLQNGGSGNNLQIAEFEMTEQTGSVNGGVAGGFFNLLNSSSLTCTATQGVVIGSATNPVQFSGVSGSSATLTANLPAGTVPTTTVGAYTVLHNGTGTLNIIGDIVFSGIGTGIVNRGQINSTSTGILRITGAVSSVSNTSENNNQCIQMTGGSLFLNGTVSGGSTGTRGQIIVGGTSTITITGDVNTNGLTNITGGSNITVIGSITNTGTGAAINATTATVNVTGAITCSNSGSGVSSTTGVITVGGPITASTSTNGVISTLALVQCSGLLTNTNNFQAVYAPRITIEPTTTSITFQKITGGDQIMYIGSSTAYNLPAINNVRSGSVYGASNELTGTMIVQTPENVLLGTLVDNTVGTLIMTPTDFVTELNTSGTPVAVRLRNCATVSTTGDQVASYSN